jgi:carbamoyltransferase
LDVLGISAFYHDSAACLLRDGVIVAAAQEERFTRKKGDASFPKHAVDFCLKQGGITVKDLDYVGFYDKPLLKFERILETYLGTAPKGMKQFVKAGPLWMKEKLYTDREIRQAMGYEGPLLYAEHHESHAASAFFPSPYEEAAILTMDGVGEWATSTIGVGRGNDIEIIKELKWPDSLGLLYSAFTYFTGFKVNSGEYKVMGLAPYGEPKYVDIIYKHLVELREDGSFTLNQEYFDYLAGLTMTNGGFTRLFGGPAREPESKLTQREMDLARSVQVVCEEIMLRMAKTAHKESGLDSLCLAGGVALNCVGNGRLLREGPFKNIWIQPAAGDAGGALGVAQLIWHRECKGPRTVRGNNKDTMSGSYLGPAFSDKEIETFLNQNNIPFEKLPRPELNKKLASLLADEKVLGWFDGRMEFGPRSLGSRSILGDPRSPRMQAQMNLKIKFRESFRPFAPSVLRERVSDYFELNTDSPYMLLVAPVKKERQIPMTREASNLWGIDLLNVPRSDLPAITHIDYSARVQTVSEDVNPNYHALIKEFENQTGCAVLVNTSFNVRGEPIVCTPEDAYRCFMRTHIDYLVLGTYLLDKTKQPALKEDNSWKQEFQLD